MWNWCCCCCGWSNNLTIYTNGSGKSERTFNFSKTINISFSAFLLLFIQLALSGYSVYFFRISASNKQINKERKKKKWELHRKTGWLPSVKLQFQRIHINLYSNSLSRANIQLILFTPIYMESRQLSLITVNKQIKKQYTYAYSHTRILTYTLYDT